MELILGSLFASPLVAAIASLTFALALLSLLAAACILAGVYYTGPKMIVKWLSRRALRGI